MQQSQLRAHLGAVQRTTDNGRQRLRLRIHRDEAHRLQVQPVVQKCLLLLRFARDMQQLAQMDQRKLRLAAQVVRLDHGDQGVAQRGLHHARSLKRALQSRQADVHLAGIDLVQTLGDRRRLLGALRAGLRRIAFGEFAALASGLQAVHFEQKS
jgi:hypothetical protein